MSCTGHTAEFKQFVVDVYEEKWGGEVKNLSKKTVTINKQDYTML